MRSSINRFGARALAVAVAGAGLAALSVAPADATPAHPAATYCKIVRATNDIAVFNSPGGDHAIAYWKHNSTFLVDRTDAPKDRYHVAGQNEWVTSDSRYVGPC